MPVAITLWEAYLIETPLAKGMSTSALLDYLSQGDSQSINTFDDTFDYTDLVNAYNKCRDKIEEAIKLGYTIKFVSIHGIKRLIHLKFGLEEGKDYDANEDKINDIRLNEEQLATVTMLLSPNWHINSTEINPGSYKVDILHITAVK